MVTKGTMSMPPPMPISPARKPVQVPIRRSSRTSWGSRKDDIVGVVGPWAGAQARIVAGRAKGTGCRGQPVEKVSTAPSSRILNRGSGGRGQLRRWDHLTRDVHAHRAMFQALAHGALVQGNI